MKEFRNFMLVLTGLLLFSYLLIPEEGESIPAFARKYGFSCTTCHIATPKLKPYGADFAANGFRLAEDEEPERAYQDTGDDNLTLMRNFPIGIRFDAYSRFDGRVADSDNDFTSDLEFPYGIKILSGGSISEHIGYYFYFFFDERGEVGGVEDAYIHFNNLGGSELDIMVGQFQISDPLFKRELRLTFEDYQVYGSQIGLSRANLKYDRGIMMTYGWKSGTDLVFELVNGNGKADADAEHIFDSDKYKSVFLKLNQSWDNVRLGMFGYTGREKLGNAISTYSMFGPDATLGGEKTELNFQYLRRIDTNPFFVSGWDDDIITDGVIGELILNPNPKTSKVLYTFLYNKVWSEYDVADYESITGSISYMLRTNMRFLTELTLDTEPSSDDATSVRFIVGCMTGF